jgi:hypothetical protein
METVCQSVAIFGGARAARDPLQQLVIPGAQTSGLTRPERPAEERLVLDHWRRRRLGGRTPLIAAIAATLRPLPPVPLPRLYTRKRGLAQQHRPVERQIRMRVLERLDHFRLERLAADLEI